VIIQKRNHEDYENYDRIEFVNTCRENESQEDTSKHEKTVRFIGIPKTLVKYCFG